MSEPKASDPFTLELAPGAIKEAMQGSKSSDLWKVAIGDIVVIEGFNARVKNDEYHAKVREIADSIKANGFYQDKPLAVYVRRVNGVSQICVTDGHTRLDAAKLAISEGAEITHLPVVTKPNGTSMEDLTVALVTSNSGRSLTPYEVAVVCKRLIGFGMTESEIANRLSVSETQIKNYLLLTASPKLIRDLVSNGKVSATLAIDTVKKHGVGASKVLSEAVTGAEAFGKSRVTKKLVAPKAKAAKPAKRDLLGDGAAWIVKNDPDGSDDRLISLLALMCEVEPEMARTCVAELRVGGKKLRVVGK